MDMEKYIDAIAGRIDMQVLNELCHKEMLRYWEENHEVKVYHAVRIVRNLIFHAQCIERDDVSTKYFLMNIVPSYLSLFETIPLALKLLTAEKEKVPDDVVECIINDCEPDKVETVIGKMTEQELVSALDMIIHGGIKGIYPAAWDALLKQIMRCVNIDNGLSLAQTMLDRGGTAYGTTVNKINSAMIKAHNENRQKTGGPYIIQV